MEIYVVVGTTGEYSDRTEWMVCAYRDEQLAKDHVVAATAWADAEKARRDAHYQAIRDTIPLYSAPRALTHMYPKLEERVSPYDPQMRITYTGTGYSYSRVPVRDRLPEEVPATSG